jgi:hypothetical protein
VGSKVVEWAIAGGKIDGKLSYDNSRVSGSKVGTNTGTTKGRPGSASR